MFSLIYIEKEIAEDLKVVEIQRRFPNRAIVWIDHYMEVFNRRAQNFRLQKRNPALILAKKHQNYLLKTPPGYGIGTVNNYYFSHLLNCPFDCRYCFLQGMYQSAHFVHFINQKDFFTAVEKLDSEATTFFTGYDCDSLAFENLTGFAKQWLPWISRLKGTFEFRTKSLSISPFLNQQPLPNCVVAYTLTPEVIGKKYEHKTPSLEKRLEALEALQKGGWKIGLRFDPMIPEQEHKNFYQTFFRNIFSRLDINLVHSVSLGGFRVPKGIHKKMTSLYPDEPLFAYPEAHPELFLSFCEENILKYFPKERLFSCYTSLSKGSE